MEKERERDFKGELHEISSPLNEGSQEENVKRKM
jgi:hypothetical protein